MIDELNATIDAHRDRRKAGKISDRKRKRGKVRGECRK